MIKLTPLPCTTTLESITSWILTLTDPPYNLPQPRFIDMTKDFNQGLLIYNQINDQLISDLFHSILELNKIEINPLEQERLISVGITHHHHSSNSLQPIRFKFISSGYLESSILGLYSSSNLLSRQEEEAEEEKPTLNLITTQPNSSSKRKSEWDEMTIKQKKLQLKEVNENVKKQELLEDSIKCLNKRSNRLSTHQKLINSIRHRNQSNQIQIQHHSSSTPAPASGSRSESNR